MSPKWPHQSVSILLVLVASLSCSKNEQTQSLGGHLVNSTKIVHQGTHLFNCLMMNNNISRNLAFRNHDVHSLVNFLKGPIFNHDSF